MKIKTLELLTAREIRNLSHNSHFDETISEGKFAHKGIFENLNNFSINALRDYQGRGIFQNPLLKRVEFLNFRVESCIWSQKVRDMYHEIFYYNLLVFLSMFKRGDSSCM